MDKQPILDDLFAKACQQEPVASFNETKAQFLKGIGTVSSPSIATRLRRFLTFKKWIIMFTLLSTIALTVFITSSPDAPTHTLYQSSEKMIGDNNQTTSVQPISEEQPSGKQLEVDNVIYASKAPVFPGEIDHGMYVNLPLIPTVNRAFTQPEKSPVSTKMTDDSDEYLFPKLTEEEISATNKQKKSMLKALSKFDKKVYAYIPTGTFDYAGKQISVQSFYMQTTEVTNLEYRTFLFDLLIHDRKADFLLAKPDQAQWSVMFGGGMKTMEDNYFSHEAYNKYPVVNVSRAGAELYCKWLTEECNKSTGKKNPINDVRIPSRTEWVFAATAGGKQQPYPWNGNEVRNAQGCYLANFKPEPDNYHVDGAFDCARATSYNPSELGLYCLSGNVSEMVYNSNTDRSNPGTAGGNWTSTDEEIKLLSDDPYAGETDGKPTIGFRVVVTTLTK